MSREPIPITVPDISLFARNIARQLQDLEAPPSHLSLMNLLARAAGFGNYQHLRAAQAARIRLAQETLPENIDYCLVERTLRQFDRHGRLLRWPSRRSVQELCLWALWGRLPSGESLREQDINALLRNAHLFDDPALLRRSLVDFGLVSRNRDGSDYQRQERRPPVEAREVIRRIKACHDGDGAFASRSPLSRARC